MFMRVSDPISHSLITQIHFSVWKVFSVLFLSRSQSQQQREEVIWNVDFLGILGYAPGGSSKIIKGLVEKWLFCWHLLGKESDVRGKI